MDPRGRITREQFEAVYKALKEEEKLPKDEAIPAYHVTFIQRYLAEEQSEQKGEKAQVSWEDQLAALYYEASMNVVNPTLIDVAVDLIKLLERTRVIECDKPIAGGKCRVSAPRDGQKYHPVPYQVR